MSFPEQVNAARDAALRLLAVRERSESELHQRLRTKGFDPAAIVAAVARLQEVDLQSDARFAERYAQAATQRGKSVRLVQGELRARGVSGEVAAQAATASPEQERDRALELARVRAHAMVGEPREVVYRRVAGLLARRGYESDICRTVATEVAGEDPGDERADG
jgi:regulatory protein